jgi:hypothetical protein
MARTASGAPARQMPVQAVQAALATFAEITRERHPGIVLLPLARVGADATSSSSQAVRVIRPFAESPYPLANARP